MIALGGPTAVVECKKLVRRVPGAVDRSTDSRRPTTWSARMFNERGSRRGHGGIPGEALRPPGLVHLNGGNDMSDIIRIGNCSGYYGDRLAAARELVDGGPIDVLTGDYLAELTMSILYNQVQTRGAHLGYVGTFLKQVRDVAATCFRAGHQDRLQRRGAESRGHGGRSGKDSRRTRRTRKGRLHRRRRPARRPGQTCRAGAKQFTNLDTGTALSGRAAARC